MQLFCCGVCIFGVCACAIEASDGLFFLSFFASFSVLYARDFLCTCSVTVCDMIFRVCDVCIHQITSWLMVLFFSMLCSALCTSFFMHVYEHVFTCSIASGMIFRVHVYMNCVYSSHTAGHELAHQWFGNLVRSTC